MASSRVSPLVTLLAVALLALGAAPAAHAKPAKVPKSFFGTVLDPPITVLGAVPDSTLDQQFARMRASGVESVRVTFSWSTANPSPGVYDWREIDRLVAASSAHKVALLPIVQYSPPWASSAPPGTLTTSNPPVSNYPPKTDALYAAFITTLIKRYGPKGTYFKTHPGPAIARVRQWQIWNEPMQAYYWGGPKPWYKTYGPMLKAAHTAAHKADRKAVVVTAGLSGSSGGPSWEDLDNIYKTAGRKAFDAVAINQYTNAEGAKYNKQPALNAKSSVDHLFQVDFFVRRVMQKYKDKLSKPIYQTEFGWTAALGKVTKYRGLETTPKGSADRLALFVKQVARRGRYQDPSVPQRRLLKVHDLGITRAYWYTWASGFNNPGESFSFSGLNQWLPGQPFVAQPLLSAYRATAKRY